jgi:hypothetical protein
MHKDVRLGIPCISMCSWAHARIEFTRERLEQTLGLSDAVSEVIDMLANLKERL